MYFCSFENANENRMLTDIRQIGQTEDRVMTMCVTELNELWTSVNGFNIRIIMLLAWEGRKEGRSSQGGQQVQLAAQADGPSVLAWEGSKQCITALATETAKTEH